MRPLFLEFPEDKRCYSDKSLTFMFESSLLVANVVEKDAKTRKLYLPAGCMWYDMNDNLKAYPGGQKIEIPVDRSSIPMFLRDSAILVTTEDVKHILKDTMHHADILLGGDTDSAFVLYDDDGHSEDFENGVYARTEIQVTTGDRTKVTFRTEGSYEQTIETMTLKMVSKEKGAYWATIDGKSIPRHIIRDAFSEADLGWYYDMSDCTICVKFPVPEKKDFEVVISKEKFDLIGMAEE